MINQKTLAGKIVPGATLTVFLSNMLFGAWTARLTRLSHSSATTTAGHPKEPLSATMGIGAAGIGGGGGGNTFTTLPHGISTVLFFAFTMLIMAPVYQKTGDAQLAYRTGLACCLMLGVLELVSLFLVDQIRKVRHSVPWK